MWPAQEGNSLQGFLIRIMFLMIGMGDNDFWPALNI